MQPEKKRYGTRAEKIRDLLIGFFGWFLVNGLVWGLVALAGDRSQQSLLGCIMLPVNVTALIALAFKRRWLALGVLAALALNLAISLILGLAEYGMCGIPVFFDSFLDYEIRM